MKKILPSLKGFVRLAPPSMSTAAFYCPDRLAIDAGFVRLRVIIDSGLLAHIFRDFFCSGIKRNSGGIRHFGNAIESACDANGINEFFSADTRQCLCAYPSKFHRITGEHSLSNGNQKVFIFDTDFGFA